MMPESPTQERDAALYHRLARPMWAVLYARCCDAELALDAVQEAFVRWREQDADRIDEPAGWLLRVASNWMTDQLRRNRPTLPYHEAPELAKADGDPADVMVRHEMQEQVRSALNGLRLEDREVLVLRYSLDWSSARIGEALGLTIQAVDMRLSRARRRLGDLLKQKGVVDVTERSAVS
jgi:RNA polymerase sigma factor (sigma-70 family)